MKPRRRPTVQQKKKELAEGVGLFLEMLQGDVAKLIDELNRRGLPRNSEVATYLDDKFKELIRLAIAARLDWNALSAVCDLRSVSSSVGCRAKHDSIAYFKPTVNRPLRRS